MARVLAARELDQANLGHAGGTKDPGGGLVAGADVRRVVARVTDRGDADEPLQVGDDLGQVGVDAPPQGRGLHGGQA